MQKYPKSNSVEMSIYKQKAFATTNFPVFFGYRNKSTCITIPGISAYLLLLSQIIR